MVAAVDDLGDDPVQLRARIVELSTQIDVLGTNVAALSDEKKKLLETNAHLANLVDQFRRMIYGRRSERHANDKYPALPFAGEEPALPPPPHVNEAPDEEHETTQTKRRARGVRRQRADLPRVREVLDLPEDQRLCPCCGKAMQPIGEDVTEELDYQPAVLRVREIVRVKYACKAHEESGVVQPELPPRVIAKGTAGPSLIAQVVVSKYKDHLPLYRQSKIFDRFGVDLPESTLGDWIKDAAKLLNPVVQALKVSILESFVIQSDDTGILVQDRSHPNGSRRGYLWAYVGDRDDVVFDFTPGRTREGPLLFLDGYRSRLQVDAYSGYDATLQRGRLIEVGCWAHARRYFFDALDSNKELAGDALAAIRMLYDVEREAKNQRLDADATKRLRQERSKPVLDQMLRWLEGLKRKELPKSPLGKAIGYALNQWAALNQYLDDGRLAIDNNIVERQIRGVAVGRKNWLFAGSVEGAKRAATLYSIICTCALQGVEPWAYLTDVLSRLAGREPPADLTPRAWKARRPAVVVSPNA